jgi:hypothetical protein
VSGRDRRWPDPIQRLAIEAAVAEPHAALAAWRRLLAEADLADLWDAEVYRLLPLVWRRLGDDVGPEQAERLRGLYRKSWVSNQHHLHQGAELIARLQDEDIESLVLKGLPLALRYYGDLAVRPMGDVDLLVHPEHATATWRLLEDLGYETLSVRTRAPSPWEREGDDDWFLRLRHARGFRRNRLDLIDVHSTLSLDFVAADPDVADLAAVWADQQPIELGPLTAATLSTTHHLFHTVLHGLGSSTTTMLRWIVDALTILRTAGDEVDWEAFVTAAHHHHCALLVDDGVAHLVDEWDAPIPASVRAGLAEPGPDRRERAVRWIRQRAGTPVVGSGYAAGLFVTSTRGLGPLATVGRAPGFLADHWHLDRRRDLPKVVVHKLRHRGEP